MKVDIRSIKLGVVCCYVVQGEEGTIMIDAGSPGQAARFRKAIATLQLNARTIRLIVITHGHWDHIGSAKDIQEITGAKIAMHHREKDWLEKSLKRVPPPVTTWGRIFRAIMTWCLPLVRFPAAKVDVVLGDGELSLADYGIPGKIIYTPGHSMGSVTVLLDTGEAFVGDLAMNAFPLRLSPGLPIFAEDLPKVKESWKLLLEQGAKTVYPAPRETVCGGRDPKGSLVTGVWKGPAVAAAPCGHCRVACNHASLVPIRVRAGTQPTLISPWGVANVAALLAFFQSDSRPGNKRPPRRINRSSSCRMVLPHPVEMA